MEANKRDLKGYYSGMEFICNRLGERSNSMQQYVNIVIEVPSKLLRDCLSINNLFK